MLSLSQIPDLDCGAVVGIVSYSGVGVAVGFSLGGN